MNTWEFGALVVTMGFVGSTFWRVKRVERAMIQLLARQAGALPDPKKFFDDDRLESQLDQLER